MRRVILFLAVISAFFRHGFAAEEEPSRIWRSRTDRVLVTGVFWRVEKGVIEIKSANRADPIKIKLADLSAEDVQYLLRNDGGVVHPTAKLLQSGYLMDKNGAIVPQTKYHRTITGTVKSRIGDDMMIVADLEKQYVLSCDATAYKKGKRFTGWVYPLKETLSLPNGTTSRIYRAYVSLGTPKRIIKLIRSSPLAFAKYVTGSSTTYRALMKTQEKLRNSIAAEKRHTTLVKERTTARSKEVKKRTDARLEEQTVKRRERVTRDLASAESKIKTLESNVKGWESRKRNSKMHSHTYNAMRKKIGAAKHDVIILKKRVREYKAELKELGE